MCKMCEEMQYMFVRKNSVSGYVSHQAVRQLIRSAWRSGHTGCFHPTSIEAVRPIQVGSCPVSGDPVTVYEYMALVTNFCHDSNCTDCLRIGGFFSRAVTWTREDAEEMNRRAGAWLTSSRRAMAQRAEELRRREEQCRIEGERREHELREREARVQSLSEQVQSARERLSILMTKGGIDKGLYNELVRYSRMKMPMTGADLVKWIGRVDRLVSRAQAVA